MRRASARRLSAPWLALVLALAACSRSVAPLPPAPATAAPAPQAIVFPKDAAPHDALTEWWYFTGHLRDQTDGHEYGFEFTIFQVRRQDAAAGHLAHFAVTDVDGQRFSHQARSSQGAPQTSFPLRVQDWSLSGDDTVTAAMQPAPGAEVPYALELHFTDDKLPAPHHGGFIDNEPSGGSYYYSRTRLSARGTLREGDTQAKVVEGQAWMDHQWGNFVVAGGGWDWYSLQLDDGTELMLYVLRQSAAPLPPVSGTAATAAYGKDVTAVYGSQVLADGSVRDLQPDEVRAEPLDRWISPHSGAVYPSGWRLTIRDQQRLVLRPLVQDQELYFPGFGSTTYWEGAVSIDGDRTGRGYVELTGYAERAVPAP